jgi:mono/diheme cytochrome c family protein
MSGQSWKWTVTGGLTVAVLVVVGAVGAGLGRPSFKPIDDPARIAAGHALYDQNCASCHGAKLEGQQHWWEPGEKGRLPAPPHDESGHSWQHSDAELYELVAHSVYKFTAPGYQSDMPAFADILSDDQIHAVLAFIKSTWPPGVRAYQAAQNPGGPTLADLPGDWNFPPSCGYHFGPKSPT